jgi:hypothetical protein
MPKLEISKVHDAYAADAECPLCALRAQAEQAYLRSFTHSRVMEPNVRVQTNRTGFCPDHYRQLYDGEGKLGLALMVHTHLQEALPGLRAALETLGGPGGGRRAGRRLSDAGQAIASLRGSCFICGLLDADVDRWVFTILYLYAKDPEFPPRLRASRGFCLGHFLAVRRAADRMLRPDRRDRFLADLTPLMTGSLERLEREVQEFTQLYQDSNRGLGTEAQRTALARAILKLSGG